jgi:5-methylcytosine-specific restriction enzyme subunit McrC
VTLNLIEYGKPAKGIWDKDLLNALRVESRRWKDILGLNEEPFLVEEIGQGKHSIKAQGVTGFIQVGELSIEIQPKFLSSTTQTTWRRALWQILTAVEEQPEIGSLSSAGIIEKDESFSDLLGWILLNSLRRGRLEGFPRGYVEARDSLPVFRGRLDLGRISDLITRPYLVPCIFDVFCEDTPANRLFRWAAGYLSPVVRSAQLSRMLSDEAAAFADVGTLPPGLIEAEHITLPVQYQHLLPALQVSRLLMRRQSIQHQQDDYHAPSFLWKSSTIFEKFVGYLLYQIFDSHQGLYVDSPTQVLAHRGKDKILTYPDYRVRDSKRTHIVLDAKYKTWRRRTGQPLSQDVYQMIAAGRINNCDNVFLVYPCPTTDHKFPLTWRIRGEGKPIKLTAIFINLLEMGKATGEAILLNQLQEDVLSSNSLR